MDVLYKRTKTGASQYWKVEVIAGDSIAQIRKESGKIGGKPVIHLDTISEGKNIGKSNETTPEEQAVSQALSDWKKKKDEGYKSLKDLNIGISGDLMHYSIDHVPYETLTEALNAALPKFNTDASGNVKPMLAKNVNWKKVKFPCYVQPKLDGVRCLMVVNFEDKICPIRFLSRKGKDYLTFGHISSDVITWLAATDDPFQSFILDGEIYSDELSFQGITKAVKKLCPNSLKLKFRAYDVVSDESQEDRFEIMTKLVEAIESDYIVPVETALALTKEDVIYLHDSHVKNSGYEGAMIRLLDGKYEQGFRSYSLMKVKIFDEDEFEWVGWEFGVRGNQDLLAICKTKDGQVFKPVMFGTIAEKTELYEKSPTKGAKMIVKYFGLTDGGIPRHPNGKGFRDYE